MGVYKLQTGSFSNPHLGVVHQALVTLARGGSPVAEARVAVDQLSFLPRTTQERLHLLLDGANAPADLVRAAKQLADLDKKLSIFDPLPMLDQRRRQAHASVINVDLAQFGLRTRGVEPGFVDAQVGGLLKKLVRIVKRHGGEVTSPTGDGFVARITGRNSARRAVLAAVEMQSLLESLNKRLYRSAVKVAMQKQGFTSKEQWGEFVRHEAARAQISKQEAIKSIIAPIDPIISKGPWEMRVGVATGLISEARIGKKINIMGYPPNAAERMQSAAKDDEAGKKPSRICIDEATMNELGGQFETALDFVSTKESRHTQERVRVYFVMGRTVSHDMGLLGRSSSAQMVGRDAEKEQLIDLIMREGASAKIVSLEGVSGSGKSALVASVLEEVKESCDFIVGQAEAFSLRPLGVLVDALKVRAGIRAGDKSKTIAEKISRLASHADTQQDQDGQSREQQRTFYAHLLSILFDEPRRDISDEIRSLQKNPSAFNAKMREMLVNLLGGLSRTKNLVLVFDDLQKIDPSSLSLVESLLAHELKNRPITVVKMVRPEETNLHADTLGSTLMKLGTLADRHIMEIVQGILDAGPSGDTAFKIMKKANGNPGFAIEIATAVKNGSSLDDIPGTIQGIFESQFERLSQEYPRAMQILNRAAIVGREFSLQDLTGLGLPLVLVEEAVSRLMEKQFIEATGNGDYVFVQDIIRDAVLNTIDPAQKKDLHWRYADYLQSPRNADPRKDFLEIAAHYLRADREDMAGVQYIAESQRLIDFRYDQAALHAEEALRLVTDKNTKVRALFALDEALFRQRNISQKNSLESKRDLLREAPKDLLAEYFFRLGRSFSYSQSSHNTARAIQLYNQALQLLDTASATGLRAKCLVELGNCYWSLDPKTAQDCYEQAARLLSREDSLRAVILSNIANLHLASGDYVNAVRVSDEALQVASKRDLRPTVHLLNYKAVALFCLGDFGEAKSVLEEAVAIATSLGGYSINLLRANQARVLSLMEDQLGAAAIFEDVFKNLDLKKLAPSTLMTLYLYRALLYVANQDLNLALEDAQGALALSKKNDDSEASVEAVSNMVFSQIFFAEGQMQKAYEFSSQSFAILQNRGMKLEEFDIEIMATHARIAKELKHEEWRSIVSEAQGILFARSSTMDDERRDLFFRHPAHHILLDLIEDMRREDSGPHAAVTPAVHFGNVQPGLLAG